jgi:hypothetical protein
MTESFTSPQTREQVRLDFAERVEPRGDDAAERRDVSGRRTADSDKTTRGSRPSTGRTRSRRRQLFRRNLLPGVLSQSRKGTESEGHGAENAADGEFFIADERHLYNMGIHVKQELNLSRLAALVVTSPVKKPWKGSACCGSHEKQAHRNLLQTGFGLCSATLTFSCILPE